MVKRQERHEFGVEAAGFRDVEVVETQAFGPDVVSAIIRAIA